MFSLNLCSRCSAPTAGVSPGGLCLHCAITHPGAQSAIEIEADATSELACASTGLSAFSTAWGVAEETAPFSLPDAPTGYELLRPLGNGGMGAVYLAREQATGRLVAMKFLHRPDAPNAIGRFLAEFCLLAQLDHPNIVQVLAADFLRAEPYFTMELMPGGPLARALAESQLRPIAEAVGIARAVAPALIAAHARGIIHCDIKPSNILLAGDGTPKVSDFGLAQQLSREDPLPRVNKALGTASYMPPEQVSSEYGDLGPWSDVYGLGATLYHLLTGSAPLKGGTTKETILRVLTDLPLRPRALRPEIPPALEGIVLKCLEKDAADRYRTMAELAADLARFSAGRRPVAPPLTLWRRLIRWGSRSRAALVVGAAIVAGGIEFSTRA